MTPVVTFVDAKVVRIATQMESFGFCVPCQRNKRRAVLARLVVKVALKGEVAQMCFCTSCALRANVQGAPGLD